MQASDVVALIVTGGLGLVVIALAAVLLSGRGAFLIAGYNTASKKEKEKYNEKALCRFIGGILLPIGLGLPAVALGSIYRIQWISSAFFILVIALVAFALVYSNTSKRLKK